MEIFRVSNGKYYLSLDISGNLCNIMGKGFDEAYFFIESLTNILFNTIPKVSSVALEFSLKRLRLWLIRVALKSMKLASNTLSFT